MRHHFLVHRKDPFVALFWLLFFNYEAIMAPHCQRGAISKNGPSEAPIWLHLFCECRELQTVCLQSVRSQRPKIVYCMGAQFLSFG